MVRHGWNLRMALKIHMADKTKYNKGLRESICWVTGRRGLLLTLNPERVTCKFCKRILEEKNVDEG